MYPEKIYLYKGRKQHQLHLGGEEEQISPPDNHNNSDSNANPDNNNNIGTAGNNASMSSNRPSIDNRGENSVDRSTVGDEDNVRIMNNNNNNVGADDENGTVVLNLSRVPTSENGIKFDDPNWHSHLMYVCDCCACACVN